MLLWRWHQQKGLQETSLLQSASPAAGLSFTKYGRHVSKTLPEGKNAKTSLLFLEDNIDSRSSSFDLQQEEEGVKEGEASC